MDILNDEEFVGMIEKYVDKIAPLMTSVKLPANQQGVVNPAFIAQLAVGQRILQIQMDLEIRRLSAMFQFLARKFLVEQVDTEPQSWIDELCKYLHTELEQYTDTVLQALQEAAKQQESKIILPNGQQPKMMRPV